MHIQELMSVAEHDRDLDWLNHSLRAAVELELATLPPYLTALWSIDDGWNAVTAGITAVAKEEMLHMVLAGNMLRSIGGEVKLVAPTYPGPLPGEVIPGLTVPLQKLTKQGVRDVFMVIEQPECGPLITQSGTSYSSIGAFYDAILARFDALQPTQTCEGQLTGTVGGHPFGVIDTLEKVHTAITEIKEQGEGTSKSPFTDPEFGSELSHYYRFAEIYYGRQLVEVDGHWVYQGEVIEFPEVFDMAPVPEGGYTFGPPELDEFNKSYRTVLDELEAAWGSPDGESKLGFAIEAMYGLQTPAQKLMSTPRPGCPGNYGPDWRYMPSAGLDQATLSYYRHIRPLFTADELLHLRAHGVFVTDLRYMLAANGGQSPLCHSSFDDHANARAVQAHVAGKSALDLPGTERWSQRKLDLFQAWIDSGFNA